MKNGYNKNPFESNDYPLDMEAKEPLQLRRGSDAEARRSLIEKYKGDINQTDDGGVSYNIKKGGVATGNETSMAELDEEIKQKRSKRLKIILLIVALLVVAVTVTLIFTLHKKKPHPTPHPEPDNNVPIYVTNPYSVSEIVPDGTKPYGYRLFNLTRNSTLEKNYTSVYASPTLDNKHIDLATLRTSVVPGTGFKGVRLQFTDQNSSHKQYTVANEFLDPLFVDQLEKDELNYEAIQNHFKVEMHTNRSSANESAFSIKGYCEDDDMKENIEFLSTKDQELFLMTHYQSIQFQVKSQRIFGWGERSSSELFLHNGNYTIFPKMGSNESGPGAHPFVIMQISGFNKFFGMFLLNSNPMSLEVAFRPNCTNFSTLTLRAAGGILDIFMFFGPTFSDVLQQYSQVIGRPKMLPAWAHGLFAKSLAYNKAENVLEAVDKFKEAGIPLSGVFLPLSYSNDYFSKSALVEAIRAKYSKSTDLQLIYPFSYHVPTLQTPQPEWVTKFLAADNGKSFSIREDGIKLNIQMGGDEVTGSSSFGYCMDVFHPKFASEFLEPVLLRGMSDIYQGYYLMNNTPEIYDYDQEQSDPWNLPFRPSQAFSQASIIPEQATHVLSENQNEYHFNLRSLYGSKLAKQFIENLPAHRVNMQTPFVISDSAYPGLGRYGAAHLLPAQNQSFDSLRATLVSMVNMGMYGIPNVGLQLCNFNSTKDDELLLIHMQEELCVRYFQLAIVSPIAVFSDRAKDLSMQPFNFRHEEARDAIKKSLIQRMGFLIYMRSQLKKLERFGIGGSLLQPLFTQNYFNATGSDTLSDISRLMFGDSIMVAFALNQNETMKDIVFPAGAGDWLNLATFETIKAGHARHVPFGVSDGIPMYQRAGTVVPIQNPSGVMDLRNTPIELSITLLENKAHGYVYLEDGSETDFRTEFHEIWVENNIITFKQQDILGQNVAANDTIIDQITLTFVDRKINVACAIMKDLTTIQPLYAQGYNVTRHQVTLQARDDNNPKQEHPPIKMNEIAFIYYGYNDDNHTCTPSTFGYKVGEVIERSDGDAVSILLLQGMEEILGDRAEQQYLNIELLTDNSLSFVLSRQNLSTDSNWTREFSTEIIDRNFTDIKKGKRSFKLKDVLQFTPKESKEDFCFNVTLPNGGRQVFSTCDNSLRQLQHTTHSIFSFKQEESELFFGFGERKGKFFLESGTTYALYNNDNNVLNSHSVNKQVTQHGRNGFFPVIYSQMKKIKEQNQKMKLTAMIFYTGHGQELTFWQKGSSGAKMSLACLSNLFSASTSQDLEFVFIFDNDPIATVEAVHSHINLGPLLNSTNLNQFTLPPPSWSFGHHLLIPKSVIEVKEYIELIKNKTNFPFEGILLQESDLENGVSYTLNEKYYQKWIVKNLDYLRKKNLSMIAVSKSGYPIKQDPLNAVIDGLKLDIKASSEVNATALKSYDNQGEVRYIDYSKKVSSLIPTLNLIDFQYYYLKSKDDDYFKIGVSLKSNEISRKFCSVEACQNPQSDATHLLNMAIQKPGNLDMTVDTLDLTASRHLGTEEQLHNVNGLLEQIAYYNAVIEAEKNSIKVPFLISDSTSLGSGKLGFVQRHLDYYEVNDQDLEMATQQMQLLSLFGMHSVGVKFNSKIQSDKSYALQSILFNAYQSSISTVDFYEQAIRLLDEKDKATFNQILRMKYVFMAYARTQIFKQINNGTPFIRPLFFDFPDVDASLTIGTSYMFGPSILSTNDMLYSAKILPPKSLFCSVHSGLSDATDCISSEFAGNITHDGKLMVWLAEGTITPLYSFNRTEVLSRSDDFRGADSLYSGNYTLDLHVLNKDGNGTSEGELLIDSGVGMNGNTQYCYLTFKMVDETIYFKDVSDLVGGVEGCKGQDSKGYEMQFIYLYNFKNIADTPYGYQAGKINNETDLVLIEIDTNEHVGTFAVKPSKEGELRATYNIMNVKNITFTTKVEQATTLY